MNTLPRYSKFVALFVVLGVLALSFVLAQAQDDASYGSSIERIAHEALVQGNDAVLEELIADDYVIHTPFGDLNRDMVRDFFAAMRAAMTDFNFMREIVVEQDNLVATRTVATGIFENDFNSPFGVFPPTGQPFRWEIINIFQFNEEGKVQEEWAQYDTAAFFAQLGVPPAPAESGISEEAAQTFAERFDTIFDGANVAVADEIFAPEFVSHLPLAPELDREGWKAYVASFYEAFPDLTQEVNQVIAGKDRVILHVTYTGTHEGPLFGIPATGTSVTMNGIGIFSFDENGLATENWAVLDVVGLLAQIGAFPPAPAE